jgi:DNA (cytosine-5)-methyltransferase 1
MADFERIRSAGEHLKRRGREKEIGRWGLRGIIVGGTWDAPPNDAMAAAAGDDFMPGLTMPMKARLVGLPDGYVVIGNKDSQS